MDEESEGGARERKRPEQQQQQTASGERRRRRRRCGLVSEPSLWKTRRGETVESDDVEDEVLTPGQTETETAEKETLWDQRGRETRA